MSWSPVLGILGSTVPNTVLEYALYKPGSEPGLVLYYFGNDPNGIPALCRFVDIITGLSVTCPIQGQSYYMEVKGP